MIDEMEHEDTPQFIAGWRGWGLDLMKIKIKSMEPI